MVACPAKLMKMEMSFTLLPLSPTSPGKMVPLSPLVFCPLNPVSICGLLMVVREVASELRLKAWLQGVQNLSWRQENEDRRAQFLPSPAPTVSWPPPWVNTPQTPYQCFLRGVWNNSLDPASVWASFTVKWGKQGLKAGNQSLGKNKTHSLYKRLHSKYHLINYGYCFLPVHNRPWTFFSVKKWSMI